MGGWQRREAQRERTKTDRIKEDILKCGENEKGVNAAEFNGGPAVEHNVLPNFCLKENRDTSKHFTAGQFLSFYQLMSLSLLVSCRDVFANSL